MKIFGSVATGIAGSAGAEGDLHGAKAKLGNALNDRFAVDTAAVEEGTVGRREIDEVPHASTPKERCMRAGYAVVGDADVVLRAPTDMNYRPLDGKPRS